MVATSGADDDARPPGSLVHPCTICRVNEDDDGESDEGGICANCGGLCCSKCALRLMREHDFMQDCPACGVPFVDNDRDTVVALEKLLDKKAGRHTPMAQCALAKHYYDGTGCDKDVKAAYHLIKAAATQGFPLAHFQMGLLHDAAGATAVAEMSFHNAANKGYARAQIHLGKRCESAGNREEAKKWFTLAAEKGVVEGQREVANLHMYDKEYKLAKKWYTKAAEKGDTLAQLGLGLVLRFDDDVRRRDYKAATWLRRAAEKGEPVSQVELGNCYYEGRGVKQDFVTAMRWFRLSANQNNGAAMRCIGLCYRDGMGVSKKDIKECLRWWRKAASHNDGEAARLLGNAYYEGGQERGVKRDMVQAFMWFERGAQLEDTPAQSMLGCMYKLGQGVQQDRAMCVKYLRLAANEGYPPAQVRGSSSF